MAATVQEEQQPSHAEGSTPNKWVKVLVAGEQAMASMASTHASMRVFWVGGSY